MSSCNSFCWDLPKQKNHWFRPHINQSEEKNFFFLPNNFLKTTEFVISYAFVGLFFGWFLLRVTISGVTQGLLQTGEWTRTTWFSLWNLVLQHLSMDASFARDQQELRSSFQEDKLPCSSAYQSFIYIMSVSTHPR